MPWIVVVTLRGGLGNQMFQYAIGRAIAEKQGRTLVLDDLALRVDHAGRTKRAYALAPFGITVRLTSETALENDAPRAVVVQERRGFHPHVLEPHPAARLELHGFWQSERYFAAIAPLLREDFRLRPGPWDHAPWAARIAAARDAVCVHVRRQDYLTPAGASVGFVGRDYYSRALAGLARHVAAPQFFVFSDDLAWCRENLRFAHPHAFVVHDAPGDHTHLDFRLMTLCRHFVIANSSFSWWAAWLGSDPHKVVVAPKLWFSGDAEASQEIAPQSWLRA
jgi:hypothetical protein